MGWLDNRDWRLFDYFKEPIFQFADTLKSEDEKDQYYQEVEKVIESLLSPPGGLPGGHMYYLRASDKGLPARMVDTLAAIKAVRRERSNKILASSENVPSLYWQGTNKEWSALMSILVEHKKISTVDMGKPIPLDWIATKEELVTLIELLVDRNKVRESRKWKFASAVFKKDGKTIDYRELSKLRFRMSFNDIYTRLSDEFKAKLKSIF